MEEWLRLDAEQEAISLDVLGLWRLIIRAKERGVRFGRPTKLTAHQREEALQRLAAGETQADVARSYHLSAPTISRLAAASPFEPSADGL